MEVIDNSPIEAPERIVLFALFEMVQAHAQALLDHKAKARGINAGITVTRAGYEEALARHEGMAMMLEGDDDSIRISFQPIAEDRNAESIIIGALDDVLDRLWGSATHKPAQERPGRPRARERSY